MSGNGQAYAVVRAGTVLVLVVASAPAGNTSHARTVPATRMVAMISSMGYLLSQCYRILDSPGRSIGYRRGGPLPTDQIW
ncbi:MAG: hypothetical protein OHK0015_25200 [Chloroflexi bacterium OHK40]